MTMKWIELTVLTTQEGLEPVAAVLDDLGVSQIVIEENAAAIAAQLQEAARFWDFADEQELASKAGPGVKAYLADLPETEPLLAAVRERMRELSQTDVGLDLGALSVLERRVDDEDWADNWKAYYKPTPIGDRLLVKPSWETVEDAQGRKVLELDPGMVFGTGAHHTTRMCMELMETAVVPEAQLLDVGCGSGILAIAGLLLGAHKAVCVDIDPVARQTVAENMERNGFEPSAYKILIGDVLADPQIKRKVREQGPYDLVAANIVAGVILPLTPLISDCIKPGAPYLVSGIIRDRLEEVLACLRSSGFEPETVQIVEDWNAILAYRK
jgi:ribosomal protein L11 methyltransferase